MADKRESSGLLEALQGLYSHVVSLVVGQRLTSSQTSDHAATAHELDRSLSDYIDELARAESKRGSPGPSVEQQTHAPNARHAAPSTSRPGAPIPGTIVPSGDLSRHFRATRPGSALQPHVAEQLKRRIWDHVHEAVRTANEGDAKTAKLHVQIANSALKEAARYMPEQDYKVFAAEVDSRVMELISARKPD